jgi:Fe-S cluster assembly protein SufD
MNKHWEHARTLSSADLAPQLQAWRAKHFSEFIAQGFPTKQQENWKYTDLSLLANESFEVDNKASQSTSAAKLPAGVILISLSEALQKHADIVMPYLDLIKNTNSLVSLNLSFLQNGLFLYVPKNVVVEQPIEISHCLAAMTKNAMQHSFCLIVVDTAAQASVLETYVGDNTSKYFNNIVTAIFVRDAAKLNYYKCQNESMSTYHIANTQITQHTNSEVKAFNFCFGGQLVREDLIVALQGKNAKAELFGLYMPKQKQHMDHHTAIFHDVAECNSYQLYKGILDDAAVGVFNGKIQVQAQAQNTQAQQTNRNLLLSKTAQINTKPELEIYADQVQCQHGATVGQLDEDALFYLRSRGIGSEEAIRMLTHAFAEEVLEKIPSTYACNLIRSFLVNDREYNDD